MEVLGDHRWRPGGDLGTSTTGQAVFLFSRADTIYGGSRDPAQTNHRERLRPAPQGQGRDQALYCGSAGLAAYPAGGHAGGQGGGDNRGRWYRIGSAAARVPGGGRIRVVISARHARRSQRPEASWPKRMGASVVLVCDVTDEGEVRRIAGAVRQFGRIDVLVNNAGLGGTSSCWR